MPLLALALFLLAMLRAWKVDAMLGPNADCGGCIGRASFGNDAWLLALGLGFMALAQAQVHGWLRWPARLLAVSLALLMAADFAILNLLSARLYLLDVFKFGSEWGATAHFLRALLRAHPVLVPALAAGGALLLAVCLMPVRAHPRQARAFAAAAGVCLLLAMPLSRSAPTSVNSDAYVNLWQLHADQGVSQPYSEAFASRLATQPPDPEPRCETGQRRRPDVILVLWESLSNYHSALTGARESVVPGFDAIAQKNTWFSAFHANGFTTDHGLIATLTGRYPIPAVGRYGSIDAFAGFDDAEDSIAERLRPFGYWSGFFTTGDLGFLDKPRWLKALRFDHFEGHEARFYRDMPRGAFNAAEDRALYDRLLQWMDSGERQSPFLAVLLTVESHPPFVDRSTGMADERATFRAADRAFARFHAQLEASGFLQHGILIVMGDHRSMTPLGPDETAHSGTAAMARTPLLVAGASGLPRGEIVAPFQQTDLLPSLLQLVGENTCHRPDQGRFLRPDPQPPAFVLHARGDQRSRVDLYRPGAEAALILRGDDSHWIGQAPPDAERIESLIHRDRIRRGPIESGLQGIMDMVAPEPRPR